MQRYDKYETQGPIHYEWYKTETWYQEIIDYVLGRVVGKSVMDIGCGDGLFLSLAEKKGLECYGIDNNESGLNYAKLHAPKATLINMDIDSYQYKEGLLPEVDTVVCINTIEHLTKPEKVVEIFEDSLAGKLIIVTNVPRENKGRYHYQELDKYSWIKLLSLMSYPIIHTQDINDHFAIEVMK